MGTGERGHHERAGQARGTTWAQIPSIVASLEASCIWSATAANVNETTMFQAVVADIPPVRIPAGRRRTRPAAVHADKGDDSRANRTYLRRRGIKSRIARRQVESSARLGRHRWRVERSLSWLRCLRRLQVRWDRDGGRWFAFVLVAWAVVCFNRL